MDVSDGLAGDLAKMIAGEGRKAVIDLAAVPLSAAASEAVRAAPDCLDAVLTGGDDYEVICAIAPDQVDAFRIAAAASGVPVAAIGTVVAGDGPPAFETGTGTVRIFEDGAFRHF